MSDPEPSDTVKKERSAAQLEALSKARVKALQKCVPKTRSCVKKSVRL